MKNAYYQIINYINNTETHDVFYCAANTLLNNLEKIPKSNITQVADMCFASTATISRLCRRLNYLSFNEFKQDVVYTLTECDNEKSMQLTSIDTVDELKLKTPQQIKDEFFEEVFENLGSTEQNITVEDVIELVKMIEKSKRVIFIGGTFAQIVSNQLQIALSINKQKCYGYANEQAQIDLLDETTTDDLVILTSVMGNFLNRRLELMKHFKYSKAKKVIITQDQHHEILDYATACLIVGNELNNLIGKFSIMAIFELAEIYYLQRNYNNK